MELIVGTAGPDTLNANGAQRVEGLGGNDTITARQTPQVNAGDGDDQVTIIDPALEGFGDAGVALGNGADRLSVTDLPAGLRNFIISPGPFPTDTQPDEIRLARSALTDVAPGQTRRIEIQGVDAAVDTIVFENLSANEVQVGQGGANSSFPSITVRFGQTEVVLSQFDSQDLTTALSFGNGGSVSNSPPNAVDDVFILDGFAIEVDPLVNDTDPNGDTLEIISVGEPANGRIQFIVGVDTEIAYIPDSSFTGQDSFTYTISDGRGGTDSAVVRISDGTGLGLSVSDAQQVAYLYEAGLDRDGNIDLPGLNFWIDQREDGLTLRQLSNAFLRSIEFNENFGEPFDTSDPRFLTDEPFVRALYENVLDRTADQPGLDFWQSILDRPAFDRQALLIAFSESNENRLGSPLVENLSEVEPGEWDFVV
ncbi:MAG: DUF4214 domain-containing protein [Pseudomonadota bacterium]